METTTGCVVIVAERSTCRFVTAAEGLVFFGCIVLAPGTFSRNRAHQAAATLRLPFYACGSSTNAHYANVVRADHRAGARIERYVDSCAEEVAKYLVAGGATSEHSDNRTGSIKTCCPIQADVTGEQRITLGAPITARRESRSREDGGALARRSRSPGWPWFVSALNLAEAEAPRQKRLKADKATT